eukprot:CAMPEP_0184495276 /NCGR_PEP_ID=MMETSP0113_2-20130426/30838_1 /TAXON_ID=91329 /ORGANISM="Norrisiella sphaerica, Strain BC52" /LENGTH=225 /DNA_ID=CAMNT_0026881389 /DNA_START=171 /DNA_END=848 /DNA_ORIENTATION=+
MLRHVSANSGVQPRKKKSGKFGKMKSPSKSSIMKRIRVGYRPCVVLIDGTNLRGKFGFKWGPAGVTGWVSKWATTHSMDGKSIVVFDNKDVDEAFVARTKGTPAVVAGNRQTADDVITDAICHFHDLDINTVVVTNDKRLMRDCVAVCGSGMKARNFFFTNDDFAHVLNMPTDYVKLKKPGVDKRDDTDVISAVDSYLSRFPEGNLAITSFAGNQDIYVSPENEV